MNLVILVNLVFLKNLVILKNQVTDLGENGNFCESSGSGDIGVSNNIYYIIF